jgi:hypothetical protein
MTQLQSGGAARTILPAALAASQSVSRNIRGVRIGA